jgi:hypothetical protein
MYSDCRFKGGESMAGLMSILVREFHRQGYHPGQLQGLLKDIEIFFQDNGYRSRQRLNLELESLGWGINIIDRETYDRILQLLNATSHEGLRLDEVQCR